MNSPAPENNGADGAGIKDIAGHWVVRQDRGLTPAEGAELAAWLAADPRHARALEQSTASWRRFRELAAAVQRMPVETARPKPAWNWMTVGGLAAAAALVLAIGLRHSSAPKNAGEKKGAALSVNQEPPTQRFADGSLARLKPGAEVVAAYSATERRVRLVRGEAFFSVTKDSTRPFFVEVDHVTVRAVGTSFAVRLNPQAVDVLVTEGIVKVTPATVAKASPGGEDPSALVEAGHRAVVDRKAGPREARVVVTAVSSQDIAQSLAWKSTMLDFADTTLTEVVEAFAQRTGRRIEIGDPALAMVRIGGRFPSEDVDGFVRVLEEIYDVKAERGADSSIVLRKAR